MVLAVLLILIGIFIMVKFTASTLAPKGSGGLQVTSNIKAQITLNGKSYGEAPICLCGAGQTIPSGTYDLKIIPEDKTVQPFTAKIEINSGVLTAVERTFLPGALASSYILTLQKTNTPEPQIFISTVPDNALVSIDGDSKGSTPFLQNLSASEHDVEIDKPGYSKKTIRVRAVNNYKLVLDVILGTDTGIEQALPTVTTNPTPAETIAPTLTPQNEVQILNTPTGFLRVRATPSVTAAQIGEVKPGEKYPYVDENDSWFEITLSDGTKGWISKSYAQKITQ